MEYNHIFTIFARNMRKLIITFISIVALFATQVLPDFECCNTESFTPYGNAIEEIGQIDYSDFSTPACVQPTLSQRGSSSRRVVSQNKSNRSFYTNISFTPYYLVATRSEIRRNVIATKELSTVFKWHRIRI